MSARLLALQGARFAPSVELAPVVIGPHSVVFLGMIDQVVWMTFHAVQQVIALGAAFYSGAGCVAAAACYWHPTLNGVVEEWEYTETATSATYLDALEKDAARWNTALLN